MGGSGCGGNKILIPTIRKKVVFIAFANITTQITPKGSLVSNYGSTLRLIFCSLITFIHDSWNSSSGALFLGLQTGSSRWEPDLVDGEAIQSAIRAILPLLRSTCDSFHCLGETALFSSFGIVFSQFLS